VYAKLVNLVKEDGDTRNSCDADVVSADVERGSGGNTAGRLMEYCKWETFNASCRSPDHVIVMRSARYGRMRFGR